MSETIEIIIYNPVLSKTKPKITLKLFLREFKRRIKWFIYMRYVDLAWLLHKEEEWLYK